MEDIETMTDEELTALRDESEAELEQRRTVRDAERRTDDMAIAYLRAEGRENGGPYQPPTGFIGAYPRGWRVIHEGEQYDATAPGVVTAPPGGGWKPAEGDLVPFWEPGAYEKGSRVRDAGRIWTARQDVEGQRPSDYPAGWDLTTD